MQGGKTEHSEHEKFFRYGQCLYRQSKYALPGRQKTEHQWGRKDTEGLWRQHFQNKNCLRLVLEIPNPADYMNIVSYYAGDC